MCNEAHQLLGGNVLRSVARYPPVTALVVRDAGEELATLNRCGFNRSHIAPDNLTDVGGSYLGIVRVNTTDLYLIARKTRQVLHVVRFQIDAGRPLDGPH